MSTVIYEGRPAGLLTVVPVIYLGATPPTEKTDLAQMQKLNIQDRFLLALNGLATTGFDPRKPIDILQIKNLLQGELDKVMGANWGTVFITSAHIARRQS